MRVKRYVIVIFLSIENVYPFSKRDGSCLVERRGLCVVCFFGGIGVEGLEIDGLLQFSCYFSTNDNTMAP